jgi:catechol 2,3-dioxygenase
VTAQPIDAGTHTGAVHLTVADLDRSVDYYQDAVGLSLRERGPGRASMGTGSLELVRLIEQLGAVPSRRETGLFHLALRVPERTDLARWLAHAARTRVPLAGMSDHFVSEAVYLQDPDDHGIEIYHDRPRALWEGRGELTTEALDVDSLLAEIGDPRTAPFDGLPDGTDMGHIHLRVADVPQTVEFYTQVLGFELMATYGAEAAFLAAGGYHHHVGGNTWQSRGAPPPASGSAALRAATIVLPTESERDRIAGRVTDAGQSPEVVEDGVLIRDPSRNPLLLAVG